MERFNPLIFSISFKRLQYLNSVIPSSQIPHTKKQQSRPMNKLLHTVLEL